MGRHFFYRHPEHASAWCMPEMRELLNDGRVHLVQSPMCHWRLASTGDGDEQGFVRGKTRWATSSSSLATLLSREHAGENRRVRVIEICSIHQVNEWKKRRNRVGVEAQAL